MLSVFAQKSFNIYNSDSTVLGISVLSIDSLVFNSAATLLYIHKTDKTSQNFQVSAVDSMTITDGFPYSLSAVLTNSATYNFLTNKANCLVTVSNTGGCVLIEKGVCWSKNAVPTIKDSKLVSNSEFNQFYLSIPNLELNSSYYVRSYVKNCVGISYGNALLVKPLMGNVTYKLNIDQATLPEPYRLIKIAMDSACLYYNRHTQFRGTINVYYNTGIPTAQASYHGSIGFGSNTRYMWVGTAIHEMAHFFGSGTTDIWKSKIVNGAWTGTNASSLLKSLTGGILKGDTQHFWPYGINQKEEITGLGDLKAQENGLSVSVKLVKAMVIDDCNLPITW